MEELLAKHHAISKAIKGGAAIVIPKNEFIKEHTNLSNLLIKVGKEGEKQKKELNEVLGAAMPSAAFMKKVMKAYRGSGYGGNKAQDDARASAAAAIAATKRRAATMRARRERQAEIRRQDERLNMFRKQGEIDWRTQRLLGTLGEGEDEDNGAGRGGARLGMMADEDLMMMAMDDNHLEQLRQARDDDMAEMDAEEQRRQDAAILRGNRRQARAREGAKLAKKTPQVKNVMYKSKGHRGRGEPE